jgi:hypothetical protein
MTAHDRVVADRRMISGFVALGLQVDERDEVREAFTDMFGANMGLQDLIIVLARELFRTAVTLKELRGQLLVQAN